MLLFNFVNDIFLLLRYVLLLLLLRYVFLLLRLCILIFMYVPFWVFRFNVLFYVLFCVHVYCTTATGCQPKYS